MSKSPSKTGERPESRKSRAEETDGRRPASEGQALRPDLSPGERTGSPDLELLRQVSRVLASPFRAEATLQEALRAALPGLGEWGLVDLLGEDGSARRIAACPSDAALEPLLSRLPASVPLPRDDGGSWDLIRSGEPVLHPAGTHSFTEWLARHDGKADLHGNLAAGSLLSVPLSGRSRLLGVLHLAGGRGGHFGARELALAQEVASRMALALDNARLSDAAESARRQRDDVTQLHRGAEDALLVLTEAANTLVTTLDGQRILQATLELARRLFRADAYALWRRDADRAHWRVVAESGLSPEYDRTVPSTSEAILDGLIPIHDVETDPRVGSRMAAFRQEGIRSLLCAPLRLHGEHTGTLTLYYREAHASSDTELQVAAALANLAASSLTAAELYQKQRSLRADAVTAQQHLAFLAEASQVLASSLDSTATLEHVAHLVVPHLADWCVVHLLNEDGSFSPVAVAHADPDKARWAREIQSRYPSDPSAPRGIANVLRTGRSELYAEITDEMLVQGAVDAEHLELLRQAGFTSCLMAPLVARQQVLGAITFISAESAFRYDERLVELAEDLAQRAAAAIDNARLYQAAQSALEALTQSDRRKDEFLAMLAHELRNPIGAMSNALRVLQEPEAPETSREHALAVLRRQLRHESRLVDRLLDVSRLTRGLVDLEREPVDLVRLAAETAEDYRPSFDAAKIRLNLSLPDQSLWISGDPTRLAQALGNLLSNAVKFTGEGGLVTLRVRGEPSGEQARLEVEDTGIGITEDLLPHVFETFTQGDRSLVRSRGGLGLGLAIVRGLVELHGGTVHAESRGAGRGATLGFSLPLAPSPASGDGPAAEVAPPERTKRVLVVEDNRDAAETLRDLLEMRGHQVEIALTGPAGLERARDFRPEVVLCDIGLPGLDGYALAAELRGTPATASARLLALSGYAGPEDLQRSMAAGFDDHLVKPVDMVRLAHLIESG